MQRLLLLLFTLISFQVIGQKPLNIHQRIDQKAVEIQEDIVKIRRHLHQNPELSNREFETSKYIQNHLKKYDVEVHKDIAITGVVAVLNTGRPGPTVGLRADIDGLPVTESNDLPFKSVAKGTFGGNDVGVMHACGHDTHVAMMLGVVDVLCSMKDQLKGKIVFVFQPAEEGPPPGEEGGARLMVKEGMNERFGIEAMFGQHIGSGIEVGTITYRFGGMMAAADRFVINVKGKQAHGSRPWSGVDPIVTSAQIILGLQTIISRQTELTKEAAVITVGKITSGVRNNIIPESAELIGTIRTLDKDMQKMIHEKIRTTVDHIAKSQGATATVEIQENCPVTFNDQKLTQQMLPSLFNAIGEDNVRVVPAITGAEDFAYFAEVIPSLYYFVGGKPKGLPAEEVGSHHSPQFFIDESGMLTGVKAMSYLAVDFLMNQ